MNKLYKFYVIAFLVILVDQVVKLLVHWNMYVGEEIKLMGDFFKLNYATNPGMAFGIELGGEYGKVILTVFRICAMVGIAYYMTKSFQKKAPAGFIVCIALVLGGATGNIIDSVFYAVFDPDLLATINGVAPSTPWFHGMVVDMFIVNLFSFNIGDFEVPIRTAVFNIADAAIFFAVLIILFKQKKYFPKKKKVEESTEPSLKG